MTSIFSIIDDKHIPIYRVLWIADVPHFCGEDDCTCEGRYEVRLEQAESIWSNREERDDLLKKMESWQTGEDVDLGKDEEGDGDEPWK
ncbi:MAG: hypothetical protein COA78_23585 [Blastopirellula sp.]|nr:MAG: hypothetical protein COA78_23585 [Blastopirellula sp.]